MIVLNLNDMFWLVNSAVANFKYFQAIFIHSICGTYLVLRRSFLSCRRSFYAIFRTLYFTLDNIIEKPTSTDNVAFNM